MSLWSRLVRRLGLTASVVLVAAVPVVGLPGTASAACVTSVPTSCGTSFAFNIPTGQGTYAVSGIVAPDYVSVSIVAPDKSVYSATGIVAPDHTATVSIVAPDFTGTFTFAGSVLTSYSLKTY